ncbi:hypothetical protein MetexDRAFT_0360 [Methylorubrum extorquens DSM 13060]|jgi:hypothetical protein|nr:hypothetical protein MetexDRAFT_0360 [Methylorubrum extorquens DSM 13060]
MVPRLQPIQWTVHSFHDRSDTFNEEIPMQAFRGKAPKYVVAGMAALMILGAAAPVLQNLATSIFH